MKIAQVTTNVLGRYGVEGSNLGSCFGMQFTVLVIFVDPHVCVCVYCMPFWLRACAL